MFFDIKVSSYYQDEEDLRETLAEVERPTCIIISQALSPYEKERSPKEVCNIVKEVCPDTPIIWLSPDENLIPLFPLGNNSRLLAPQVLFFKTKITIKELINAIVDLTGVNPVFVEKRQN
jgi:hypothetical protein